MVTPAGIPIAHPGLGETSSPDFSEQLIAKVSGGNGSLLHEEKVKGFCRETIA